MKHIEIEYYPFPWSGWKRKARGSYPETWKELTSHQMIAIARTYKGVISDNRFLHLMTGISSRVLKKLDDYQRYKLFELLDFINDFSPYGFFIIDRISIGGKEFYSPPPRLKSMTFGQFIFADSFFWNYQQTGNQKEMTSFLASVYLPRGKKFKQEIMEATLPVMEKVDPVTREAVFINYLLIFEWLADIYPLVFPYGDPGQKDKKRDEDKSKKTQRDSRAWIKVFENLVGDDIVNQDKYAKLPLHNVMRYLTSRMKENMKRKKR